MCRGETQAIERERESVPRHLHCRASARARERKVRANAGPKERVFGEAAREIERD